MNINNFLNLILGWQINPCERQVLGSRLHEFETTQSHSELRHIFYFYPCLISLTPYIPVTNYYAKKNNPKLIDSDKDEFLHVLGLLLAMKNYDIHGTQRLHWSNSEHTLFPFVKFGEVMSIKRFENILKYLQLSGNKNEEQQFLEFVVSVNARFQKALAPESYTALAESKSNQSIETCVLKLRLYQNRDLREVKLKILKMLPQRLF